MNNTTSCLLCKKEVSIKETEGDLRKELIKEGLPTIEILPHKGVSGLCTQGFVPGTLLASLAA